MVMMGSLRNPQWRKRWHEHKCEQKIFCAKNQGCFFPPKLGCVSVGDAVQQWRPQPPKHYNWALYNLKEEKKDNSDNTHLSANLRLDPWNQNSFYSEVFSKRNDWSAVLVVSVHENRDITEEQI